VKKLNNAHLSKPITNLFHGEKGASAYRRILNELMRDKTYAGRYSDMIDELCNRLEDINSGALNQFDPIPESEEEADLASHGVAHAL
jgi:hypothetical protein